MLIAASNPMITARFWNNYRNNFCWGYNEWRQSGCLFHPTNFHSANTAYLLPHTEPSRTRYTQHCGYMLPGTVRRWMRGFLDRPNSLCSLLWSTVGMLQIISYSAVSNSRITLRVVGLYLQKCIKSNKIRINTSTT